MGYELKLFITDPMSGSGFHDVIATVDLCKPGYDSATYALDQSSPPKDKADTFYEGNKKVNKDCYGKVVRKVDGEIMLETLIKDDAMSWEFWENSLIVAYLAAIISIYLMG